MTHESLQIGILGCGRMTEAMLARWLAVEALAPEQVIAVVRRPERATELQQRHGIVATREVDAMLARADVVLLGVKPQQLAEAAAHFRPSVRPRTLWLSVLAGTTLATLQDAIGADVAMARAMPNTPSRIGLGATAICGSPQARDHAAWPRLLALLAELGGVFPIEEAAFHRFTAVAGSGPAYLFAFAEGMEAGARALGFSAAEAAGLVAATLHGAAALLAGDGRDAGALRSEVVSPGGTTAAALAVFAEAGMDAMLRDGLRAAAARSAELAGDPAPAPVR